MEGFILFCLPSKVTSKSFFFSGLRSVFVFLVQKVKLHWPDLGKLTTSGSV